MANKIKTDEYKDNHMKQHGRIRTNFLKFQSLLLFIFTTHTKKTKQYNTNPKKNNFIFSPTPIAAHDDAFHGNKTSRYTEWWYFDATLDQNYSVQLSIRIISFLRKYLGFAVLRYDIYKDGKLLKHTKKTYPLATLQASTTEPVLQIHNKTIMKGYLDPQTNTWQYTLCFDLTNASADLHFRGITQGWKGNNPGGDGWGVILPRATVTGTLTINDTTLQVTGEGYHDHNWLVKTSAILNEGWFWGKIYSKTFTIVWATIFKTTQIGQPTLIVNTTNKGYHTLHPDTITFTANAHVQGRKKPLGFEHFSLQALDTNTQVTIEMDVCETHHVKLLGFMNYYRFHVRCKGTIKVDSKEEHIDDVYIAEFLRFR